MTVETVMRTHVVTARPDDLVDNVAGKLNDVNVGSVVVVDDDRPVGIVTDRDISVRLDANWTNTRNVTVEEVMSTDLVTLEPETTVIEACRTMAEHSIRRVPIVDDDELLGIVTQDDLLVMLAEEIENLAEVVENESPPKEWGRTY